MKNFIREINGFFNISIHYGDTDSGYIEKNYWDVLDKAKLVEEDLCQGKNDYKTGGIFNGLFLVSKLKNWLTMDKNGIMQEHKTFEGFNDSKRLLDQLQFFNMLESKKISAMLPKSWKKTSISKLLYQRKWDFVMNVMVTKFVTDVVTKLPKIKNSKLI